MNLHCPTCSEPLAPVGATSLECKRCDGAAFTSPDLENDRFTARAKRQAEGRPRVDVVPDLPRKDWIDKAAEATAVLIGVLFDLITMVV